MAPEKKEKKKKTRALMTTIQIRKKCFPSMILAGLEAILSILDGGIALGILVHLCFKPEELLTNGEGHRGFSESFSAVADSGKRRKKKNTQYIVFSQAYKTPSESKKIENYLIVCWACVGRFCS